MDSALADHCARLQIIFTYLLKGVNFKCNLFVFLSMSAEYLLKFDFSIFQGSVATSLGEVDNVVWVLYKISYAFQQCKNFENPLSFGKVTESLKVGTFLRQSVHFTISLNATQRAYGNVA